MVFLFPNPTKSKLTVMVPKADTVLVTDLSGNIILESLDSFQHDFDVSSLVEGVYMVKTGSGYTAKFVKE